MSSPPRLYLIDGSSNIYRAYFALKTLSNSRGFPTNAIFGFTSMLVKILRDFHPEYLGIIFDAKGPTFRHHLYENYKSTRPGMPDDLTLQLPYIKKIVQGFRINALELEGYEADDVIGTIAKKASSEGISTIIISGDKDLLQLVDERISIFDPRTNKILGVKEVEERFGVSPDKLIEVLGLAGDSTDNIPGVPGIGEKTAAKLIQKYQSIAEIYRHLEELSDLNLKNKLKQNQDQAFLSKQLVTIDTSLPLSFNLQVFRVAEPDLAILEPIFKELEFSRFLKEFIPPKTPTSQNYHLISTPEEFQNFLLTLSRTKAFSFIISKDSPDLLKANITGFALSLPGGEAFYILLNDCSGLNLASVLAALKLIFEDPEIKKYGYNIKPDYLLLSRHEIMLRGEEDVLLGAYLLNPSKKNYDLKELAFEYLDYQMLDYKEFSKTKPKNLLGKNSPNQKFEEYLTEEAVVILRLAETIFPQLKEKRLDRLFFEIEMPLVKVLARMEEAGVKIDAEILSNLSKELEKELKELEKKIYYLAGVTFNINSPQQLREVLFTKLNLPPASRTKTGFSTSLEVLNKLAKIHEVPALVLEYRSLAKLKSTYIDVIPQLIHPHTGRVHTTFSQTTTATGRLSSSNPNLQNIPIRGKWGEKIRQAFVAEKGYFLVSADYSQIELRIMAHLSGDKNLKAAFLQDEDIHTRTASEIFQVPPEKVTPTMRREAKVINFGVIYGMTPMGLAEELGISRGEAKNYIENYFKKYKGVKEYIDWTLSQVREKGYTTTLFGRIRYLPEIDSPNRAVREFAERVAINTPIQGSAADIIKIAMLRIDERIRQEKLNARMILQIHDELLFEVKESDLYSLLTLIKNEMEKAVILDLPIKVSVGFGKNWYEAH